MILVVAFALDGVELLRASCLGDEVDAGVLGADAELRGADLLGPICEEPHVGIEVGVAGLIAEVGADEFLEVAALFALGLGGGAVFGKDVLERGARDGDDLLFENTMAGFGRKKPLGRMGSPLRLNPALVTR